jgi:uroporphyrin-III C-methyltransferase
MKDSSENNLKNISKVESCSNDADKSNKSNDIECLQSTVKILSKSLRRTKYVQMFSIITCGLLFVLIYLITDYGLKKVPDFSEDIKSLTDSFASSSKKIENLNKIGEKINENNKEISTLKFHFESLDSQQNNLRNMLDSTKRNELWRVLEAKYLIRLAERKVQIDQDNTTAIALLKDADNIILSLSDSRTLKLRECIISDINILGNYHTLDLEGSILKINQVIKNIEIMPLVSLEHVQNISETDVSKNINDWSFNIKTSFENFLNRFILIKHKNSDVPELLKPESDRFLRENIKMYLLISANALYKGDIQLYKENISESRRIITLYFSNNNVIVKNSLNVLQSLDNEIIEQQPLPDVLESSIAIDKYLKIFTSDAGSSND